MTRRSGSIFLMAVVLGALSAAMLYRYLRAQQREIEAARLGSGATVQLVVANAVIPIGARIEVDQVRRAAWPADLLPEGAIHELEAVVGSLARTTIERNQPLVQSQLVKDASGLLPLMIEEGMRAMSVKVDRVTGVSGFITPGSRVDVLVAGKPEGNGAGEEHSKLILQNIRVLATGTSIEQRDEKPVEVPTVTLLLSPDDAEKLTLAASQKPVTLALRNFRDEKVVETPGISTAALFKGKGRPAPAAKRPARSVPQGYSVEVLLGEKLTRQEVL